jgi:carboxylesterase type B
MQGPLGFLAIEGLEDPNAQNGGMMDQQSALRWTQTHAAAFGGDRARVMIFGQSAGGGAVLTHMMMPESKGLFHAAMIESGGPFHFRPDAAAHRAAIVANRVGCGSGGDPAANLKCLRAVSVEALQVT